jgi:hypothetical protein
MLPYFLSSPNSHPYTVELRCGFQDESRDEPLNSDVQLLII